MGAPRILIIEDDRAINDVYRRAFERDGYETSIAEQGQIGLALAESEQFDLILLDVSIPDVDGLQICRRLRQNPKLAYTPIVFVSGQTATATCVAGLDIGGDDYVAKPFNLDELRARIRAHLRRQGRQTSAAQESRLELDPLSGIVAVGDSHIRLSNLEHALLSYFICHEGQAISHEQLIREVWRYPPDTDPGIVRWQIGALRKRIEPDPKHPRYIHTIKQRGYLYRDPANADG